MPHISSKLLFLSLALVGLVNLTTAFTYTVTVGIDETDGKQGLGFDPSAINPAVGDTIAFTFQLPSYIKDPTTVQHSATQSTFDSPCTPKEGGFDTEIQDTGSANTNTGATFSLLVNDTQPLWFFSAANSDCKSGMVLAVNPPTSGETAAAFMQNAEASTGTTSSSQAQSSPSTSGSSSVSQSGSGTASSAVSPSASSSPQKDGAMSHLAQLESIFVGVVAAIGLSFTL